MNITLLAKKGGVGKSTLSILLYEAFRHAGKSVSLRDWDAQGTSSKALELILGPDAGAQQTKDGYCDLRHAPKP
jgi:cellulose biosynthesis protein BcsQ